MAVDQQADEGTQVTRWLKEAQRGDRKAFDRLCTADSRQRWLILIAGEFPPDLRGKVDPEDVLQDTLIQAWRDVGKLQQVSTAGFHGWIAGIARHRVRDVIRHYKQPKRNVGREDALPSLSRLALAGGRTPSKSVARREQAEKIAAVLDELRETYRDVIRYRILEKRTAEETAALMKKKPGNLRMTLHRALIQLRELLDKQGIESTVFRSP